MFGVKGGLNLANLTGDDVGRHLDEDGHRAAASSCATSFTEIFAIQPELLFTMKGAKYDVKRMSMVREGQLHRDSAPPQGQSPDRGQDKAAISTPAPRLGILMSANGRRGQ